MVMVYVDDIIFGGGKNYMCKEISKQMKKEFEMFLLGEHSFFLGLQIA